MEEVGLEGGAMEVKGATYKRGQWEETLGNCGLGHCKTGSGRGGAEQKKRG